jgi:hypothetical protein
MAFLKFDQVDISLLKFEMVEAIFQCVRFNDLIAKIMIIDEELIQIIRQALSTDSQIGSYLKHLADDIMSRDDDVVEYLKSFSLHKDDLIFRDGLIYISDEDNIKLEILKSCHDSKISGHLGQAKTLKIVSRNYFWPRMC